MLNGIWLGLMLISLAGGMLTGRTQAVTEALLNGGKNTLTFMITLGGSMCLWSGILRVADKAGVTRLFARLVAPLMRYLFPNLPTDGAACRAMSMNIAANVLGLGNAATPLGLQAMKHLQTAARHKEYATRNMVVFAVLNTASVQIIPTTVAALRAQAGSAAPFSILPAVWVTSLGAAVVAVTVARVFGKE
ncbi:MAG: spore maturation protein A [Ruminococcaceae bacterium]|nr:spore maturation protein A [Oscillospiraceae bacterium]